MTPTAARDIKALVAAAYDVGAAQFADRADPTVYRRLAAPLAAAVGDAPGPLLDLAAGTGALGRSFPGAVAADLSMGQLRHNPAKVRVQCDGERLPFADNAFGVAASAFGINHALDPADTLAEMARVAPVVAVSTWRRPEVPYAPKQAVVDALVEHIGTSRSRAGEVLDELTDAVGTAGLVHELITRAGLEADVREVVVEVPWPGLEAYLDYRLSMCTTVGGSRAAARRDAAEAIAVMPPEQLTWRPVVIVAVGRR